MKVKKGRKIWSFFGICTILIMCFAVGTEGAAANHGGTPVVSIKVLTQTEELTEGQLLFSQDVIYEVSVYDPAVENDSGIQNISVLAKGNDGTGAKGEIDREGQVTCSMGMTITKSNVNIQKQAKGFDNRYVFQVKLHSDFFNTNQILLTVRAEDFSLNICSQTADPVSIDRTSPAVVISYDNQEVQNDKYFQKSRTATIRVKERNFDESCLKFLVNGTGQQLEFQKSSDGEGKGDDREWTASYTFSQEGDYKVEISCEDLAGNQGIIDFRGQAPEIFTIDQTKPAVQLVFDSQQAVNGQYYAESRVAEIIIEEKNFDPSAVKLTGEAVNEGAALTYPQIGHWSSDGGVHRAKVVYSADAHYTLQLTCEDLAGNNAPKYVGKAFVIDRTDPKIQITGVEDGAAYTGTVSPVIYFSDSNYDRYEVSYSRIERDQSITDVSEELLGRITVKTNESGKGFAEKKIVNPEHIEENDGIYALQLIVYDKAGRLSEKNILYTVNRFGSVYVYSADLLSLLNGYHQSVGGDLYIKTYNAAGLEEGAVKLEIACDGKILKTMKNPPLQTGENLLSKTAWSEYQFNLSSEDFQSDGKYTITISDADKSGQVKTNRQDPIAFYVDNSPPVLDSVIGMESSRIKANEWKVDYTASDSVALESVEIYLNDQLLEKTVISRSVTEEKGSFRIHAGMNQKIRFLVRDQSGNLLDTADGTFSPAYDFSSELTVSANGFVLWYANKPLFLGSLTTVFIALCGFLRLFLMKKKESQGEN